MKKEIHQFRRNRRVLVIALLMPVMLMTLMGLAFIFMAGRMLQLTYLSLLAALGLGLNSRSISHQAA